MENIENRYQTIYKVSKNGKRMKIKKSIGEQQCFDQLCTLLPHTEIKQQYRFKGCGRMRYDFYFLWNGIGYIVELDGAQHFHFSSYIHRKPQKFKKGQTQDIKKTFLALLKGYCVIRIAYEDLKHLHAHIKRALDAKEVLYVSNLEKYQWLLQGKIRKSWIEKYNF